MFKMLFVGCGGSGGAVVGYLMDQLRADFQRAGIDKIPGAWQFVQIDMPPQAEPVAPGLGTIEQLGGHYIPLAPSVGSYELLDNALTQATGVRGEIATWAPREPAKVMVPIQLGAGQQRGIGRVAVLSKAGQLRERLNAVISELNAASAVTTAHAAAAKVLGLGELQPAVYTFVISSMAGGTGASISLDVARVLSDLTGNPAMTALFMCTADVFDTLNPENRQGVRANALAMLGELVACQTGAGEHDIQVLKSLGVPAINTGSTFRRIIPLSSRRGQGSPIGDRKPHTIYRVNGQALAAMAMSHTAMTTFRQRVIENNTPNVFSDKDNYGWGQDDVQVEWGSMGYASLSTGRDRLESYMAQWLARKSSDHLVKGHTQPGDVLDDKAVADAAANAMFGQVCRSLGLPEASDGESIRAWLHQAFTPQQCQEAAREVATNTLAAGMPMPSPGVQASMYVNGLQTYLRGVEPAILRAGQDAGYTHAFGWSRDFVTRVHETIVTEVGRSGMVYGVSLLELLSAHIAQVSQKLLELHQGAQSAASGFGAQLQGVFGALQGIIQNPATATDPVRNAYARHAHLMIRGRWCEVVGGVLAQSENQLFASLIASLRQGQDLVMREMGQPPQQTGLATVHTTRYAEWPVADEVVDPRWGASVNEVLLTDYRDFEAETKRLLPIATRQITDHDAPTLIDAAERAVRSVVTGQWDTAQGLEAPGGLLEVMAVPTFAALPTNPATGDSIVPSAGQYRWHVAPHEVLDRSIGWVRRSGYAVNDYVTASVRELATQHREPSVVEAFFNTLHLADPMTPVDTSAFNVAHAIPSTVEYAFSSIPLLNTTAGEELISLAPQRGLTAQTITNLSGSLAMASASRIDVYGYYPLAMPVAHAGVCTPASEQWTAATSQHERTAFWELRRSRPLSAGLAISAEERRAMVAGWFVGQLTGRVAVPADLSSGPASVHDPVDGQWRQFPFPYLTAPGAFRMPQDLLPAVLESHLVAVANYGRSTPPGQSMAPYRALRHLWDADPDGPTQASFGVNSLEAEKVLTQWCLTGEAPAGRPATAKAMSVTGETAQARREAAKQWVVKVQAHVLETVGTDNKAYRSVTTQQDRFATPLLRDLSDDLAVMLPEIVKLLDKLTLDEQPLFPVSSGPDY